MTLTDAGPLIALIVKTDPNHIRCVAATRTLPKAPLQTTWPCFTEAMYFVGKAGGHSAQQRLWNMRRAGSLVVYTLNDAETNRMEALMQQYKDSPMDIADASLVSVAETLRQTLIFTVDSHFYAYRINGTIAFRVVP